MLVEFEQRKFCQFRTLMHRWDCSANLIRELASKGLLRLWHPEGKSNRKGVKIVVESVLEVEAGGYLG